MHTPAIAAVQAEWAVRSRSPRAQALLGRLVAAEPELAALKPQSLRQLFAAIDDELAEGPSCRWWVVGALVRQFHQDELVGLGLIAALCPALLRVAARLEWGRDGPWTCPESFGSDLVSEAWIVLSEMAGQTFSYPARALTERVRRRLAHRRTKFRARSLREPPTTEEALDESTGADRFVGGAPLRPSTLDDLAAVLTETRCAAIRRDELRLIFVTRVLGYSVGELVDRGEGTRRSLQYRRERAEALLCA